MTSEARKTIIIAVGGLSFCLLPWGAVLFGEHYLISLFTRILIYALAAVSLDLLIGYGGLISLGHAAFVGVGGYITAIFFHHSFEGEPIAGFLPGSEKFALDTTAPGFRWLSLFPDGHIETGVERLAEMPGSIDLASAGY